jgi:hypothetical protein
MDRNLRRLENFGVSLAADFVGTLNAKLKGARVTAIEYRLKDVAISEITNADLLEIQQELLADKHCNDAVADLVKANIRVCSGHAAISATTSYRVLVERQGELDAGGKEEVAKTVQRAIQVQTGGDIKIHNENELTGDNLFVGIRLYRNCIVLNTATEPTPAPPVVPHNRSAGLQ